MALYDVVVWYGKASAEFGLSETYRVEKAATLSQIMAAFADTEWVELDPVDAPSMIVRTSDIKMVAEVEEE